MSEEDIRLDHYQKKINFTGKWNKHALEELADVSAGNSAPQDKKLFQNGEHPFVRTADVGRIRFGKLTSTTDYLNDNGIVKLRHFPKGTILFPKSGASTFLNNRVIMEVDGYVSSHLAAILAKREKIDPYFLLYFLSTVDARDLVQDHGYPSLNLPLIKSISIPTPTLYEQKRIVGILDEAFTSTETAIYNTEKNLTNVRELFETNLANVLGVSSLGRNLDNIEALTLGDICEFRRGLTYKKSDEVPISKNAILRANNVTNDTGEINLDGIRYICDEIKIPASKMLKPDCLLVCTASGSKKHLGKVGLVEGESNYAFGGFMGLLVPSEKVMAKYLFWLTRTKFYRDFIENLSEGTNINNLRWSQLSQFPVPVPPLPEQERIVAYLDDLSAKQRLIIGIYENKVVALAELKQSFLFMAFSGALTADSKSTAQTFLPGKA